MSKKLIHNLYHNFVEESEPPRRYFVLLERIETNTKQLKSIMSKKNKMKLQMICDDFDEISELETDNAFTDGFAFAVKLMSEAYAHKQKSD